MRKWRSWVMRVEIVSRWSEDDGVEEGSRSGDD